MKLSLLLFISVLLVSPFLIYDIGRHIYADYQRPYHSFEKYTWRQKNKEDVLYDAIKQYSVFENIGIEDANVYYELGRLHWILYKQSDDKKIFIQKAEEYFEKSLRLVPYWGLPYFSLSQIYFQQNEMKLYKIMMEKAQVYTSSHAYVIPKATAYWLKKWKKEKNKTTSYFIGKNLLFLNSFNINKYGVWGIRIWELIDNNYESWHKIIPRDNDKLIELLPSVMRQKKFALAKAILDKIDKETYEAEKKLLSVYILLSQEKINESIELLRTFINEMGAEHYELINKIFLTMVELGYADQCLMFLSQSKIDNIEMRMNIFATAISSGAYEDVYTTLLPWLEGTMQDFFEHDSELYLLLAAAYEKTGKNETAMFYWVKYVASRPGDTENVFAFMRFLFRNDMEYHISTYIDRLSGYFVDPSELYIFLANSFFLKDSYHDALEWVGAALRLQPLHSEYVKLREQIYDKMK